MPNNPTFIDGFLTDKLEDIRGQESAAIQDFISSQNSSGEQIQAAFTALEESQKPTLVDKGGDIALALAAIIDISKGGRSGRLASGKFREFRGARRKERAGRKAEARNKLGTRLKLAEFSGDISGRNLTALLNTFGQERGDVLTSIKTEFEGKRIKALEDRTAADVKRAGKEEKVPTKEELTAAKIEQALKTEKEISAEALNIVGKFDPDGEQTKVEWRAELEAEKDILRKQRNRLITFFQNPPKPRTKPPISQTVRDLSGIDVDIQDFLSNQIPQFDIRDLVPQSGAPPVSTATGIPTLSDAEMRRLGLGRQ